ncbi:MAG: DUF520 family protein, partial [Elusimicrobia bacterium]|nr:DUF520 family protein [Elusimicrobiota bacterium]
MADFSFDVVSKVDLNIVSESINIALKEVANRYDFKDTDSNITLDSKAPSVTLSSKDEFRIKALYDVLLTRMAKRNV